MKTENSNSDGATTKFSIERRDTNAQRERESFPTLLQQMQDRSGKHAWVIMPEIQIGIHIINF